jgi:hypothetical protein
MLRNNLKHSTNVYMFKNRKNVIAPQRRKYMWYRRRPYWQRRGIFGFPFMFFFIAWFVFHSWFGFLLGIAIIVVLSLLFRAIAAGTFGGNLNAPMGQAPYQQPQQPYEQYYQPSQQPYQSYEQGYQYQSPAPTYQEPQPQYQAPQPQYDEQPQAQYPQELPPMEQ